jgi:hypothetical protein
MEFLSLNDTSWIKGTPLPGTRTHHGQTYHIGSPHNASRGAPRCVVWCSTTRHGEKESHWLAALHVMVNLTLLVLLATCHGQLKSIGESMTPHGEKERQWLAHDTSAHRGSHLIGQCQNMSQRKGSNWLTTRHAMGSVSSDGELTSYMTDPKTPRHGNQSNAFLHDATHCHQRY